MLEIMQCHAILYEDCAYIHKEPSDMINGTSAVLSEYVTYYEKD